MFPSPSVLPTHDPESPEKSPRSRSESGPCWSRQTRLLSGLIQYNPVRIDPSGPFNVKQRERCNNLNRHQLLLLFITAPLPNCSHPSRTVPAPPRGETRHVRLWGNTWPPLWSIIQTHGRWCSNQPLTHFWTHDGKHFRHFTFLFHISENDSIRISLISKQFLRHFIYGAFILNFK